MFRLSTGPVTRLWLRSNLLPLPKATPFVQNAASFATTNTKDIESSKENYFDVFNLPCSFLLDEKSLKTTYRKLMTQYHPDKHSGSNSGSTDSMSAADRDAFLQNQASIVTRAYDTLQQPHLRATHLLEIMGKPMEEQVTGNLVGHEFLLQVMEERERVESTMEDVELKPLMNENRRQIEALCVELNDAFQQEDLDTALVLTAKLQYYHRIDETIRGKMESFE